VAFGLRLRVTNTTDGTFFERTFDRFPVRIGRNPLSDLQLDFPYVSQFHVILELQGQQLMLRDLGSRNGTFVRSGRVAPHEPLDLGPSQYEFAISILHFQAFPAEVAPESAPLRMRGASFALDPAAAAAIRAQASALAGGASPAVDQVKQSLEPLYQSYRAAWTVVFQTLSTRAAALSHADRTRLLQELANEHPPLASEPDFQRLAKFASAKLQTGLGQDDERIALQAVKELASSYLPGRVIEGAKDLVAFVTRVQAVLDVFLKSFVPLRDGYKQFETKMDIRRGTLRPQQVVPTSVEGAQDPRALAAGLLDWNDQTTDGPRAIEATFADLMIHQVAILDGVMRGVKSLLHELSPTAIEGLADKKGRGGFGPFRFEGLWKTFVERHSDLADEEKETFGLIFGPEFVQAYTRMAKDAAPDGARGGSQPPGPPRR
jgi:type VI secretion system protein ImpI